MAGNKQILIVDDDAEFAGMLAEAVRDVSDAYTVQVATDARAALADIQRGLAPSDAGIRRAYDLVITDIKMPGSGGLQLLEALAEIAPETKTITMTAYHSPELASRAEQLHVHAYLIKPIALSEFRQVVRAALAGPAVGAETSALPGPLTAAQKTAAERQLANLRATTNSAAALLIHATGTVLAVDGLEASMDPAALCEALMDAQRSMAQALRQALSTDTPIQQSYYGTETYSICMYRLDSSRALATVFGPTVREGQVWYSMREAAAELVRTLAREGQSLPIQHPETSDDWRSEIEQYFADAPAARARRRRNERANSEDAAAQAATGPSVEPAEARPPAGIGPDYTPAATESPRPSPDQIDWDIPTDGTWDQVIGDARETFEGINLEEARERGLYTPQPLNASATGSVERPSVDDIDWNAPADLNWDEIVSSADQGFSGMSFEEAKKRGLVDDLEAD
jgi:CheY-like chemotaxis protein